MKYFYIPLTFLAILILASCTPNNPQPNTTSSNNSVTASWQGTIDGNSYNYTGTYVNLNSTSNYMNNPGRADGTYASVKLDKGVVPGTNGNPINMNLIFPANVNLVGTHVLNNSNNNGFALGILSNNGSNTATIASSGHANSNITLNITEFPNNIGGLIKGNFSGVLGTQSVAYPSNPFTSTTVSISFEAIRKY
jgi:hypothetical protein